MFNTRNETCLVSLEFLPKIYGKHPSDVLSSVQLHVLPKLQSIGKATLETKPHIT
jgi:hypothetical protein